MAIFARTREKQRFTQDIANLQRFQQTQRQLQNAEQRLAILRALPLAQRQAFQGQAPQFPAFMPFPQAQSRAGGELFGDFLLNQQQIAGRAAAAKAKPISPAQQITQKQLDRINLLEEKARKGTIKPREAAELRSAIRRVQPKETFTPLRIEQTKGHLEAGGETTIFGNVVPFVTRKSAINYARRQLGPNWAQASPEAKKIIDRKWPAETKGTIKVISPAGERGTIPIEDWADAKKQGFRRR